MGILCGFQRGIGHKRAYSLDSFSPHKPVTSPQSIKASKSSHVTSSQPIKEQHSGQVTIKQPMKVQHPGQVTMRQPIKSLHRGHQRPVQLGPVLKMEQLFLVLAHKFLLEVRSC